MRSPRALHRFGTLLALVGMLPAAEPVRPPQVPAAPLVPPAPLSPAESMRKIHLPPGYRVELAAAEPLVLDPVAFDWDERGRLWVVEMADYPLGMDGKGQAGGRVRILEDTNGDGRYDRASLFAEGLSFPTGILTWRGGCLVTAAPDILRLEDRDGDGRAEVREVLFTGFNPGNQQLRINGLRWGVEGWVYVANGGHHVNYGKDVRITSTRTGETIALGARDFRFKPDTGELDPLSGPAQFGRTRDAWGRWFGVQNSFPLWHYALEDHYLRRNPHVAPPNPKVLLTESNPRVYPVLAPEQRYHNFAQAGHYTSACGPLIVADPLLFGASARAGVEHALVCEPVHGLVQLLRLTPEGPTFRAERVGSERADFFASEDRWCRPVMVRTGPDGAVWVADMYRYMIEHPQWLPAVGQQDLAPHYRSGDDRGRVYRIFPDGRRPGAVPALGGLDAAALVDALASPNGWVRDKAQMLLHWRSDRASLPALERLARDATQPLGRMHALHTLESFGALTDDVLVAAFQDQEPGVRIQALVLAERRNASRVVADATQLVGDPDPRVRLQLALSIGAWTQVGAGRALAALAARDGADAIMRGAVASSLGPHLAVFATTFQGHDDLLDATFRTALGEKRDDVILALLEPPLTRAAVADAASLARARSALRLLRGQKLTLEMLAAKHPGDVRWTSAVERKRDLLMAVRQTLPTVPPAQQAFLATLLLCDPAEESAAIELLGRLLAPRSGLQPLGEYVGQLARLGDPRVPDILLREWEQRPPGERAVILDALMGREAWVPDLLGRVEAGSIAAGSFDAQRQARLLKHPNAAIRRKASSVFAATASRSRAQVVEAFRPALALAGDRAKGKAVFAQTCAACHQLEGAGLALGPDLRSVVDHSREKLLISILDPNADIQPGFTAYFCELNSGEQLYGSIAAETGGSLSFRLADGSTRAVVRSEIKSLQSSNVSLMPEGLEATLTPQALADLIAYLKAAK
ncbi:MAG: c-type cytochrome [Opitutaceae bacterium]|nr:c-type cytochrome [Opitutaceae bacterium]